MWHQAFGSVRMPLRDCLGRERQIGRPMLSKGSKGKRRGKPLETPEIPGFGHGFGHSKRPIAH
jgi:hypothetical protein